MEPINNIFSLYMNAACMVNEWIYFTSYNSNWIFRLNIESNDLEAVYKLKNINTEMKFAGLYYYKNKIWMIPWSANNIYIYDFLFCKLEETLHEKSTLQKENCQKAWLFL